MRSNMNMELTSNNSLKVAVLDDEQSARTALIRLVKAEGFEALAFSSGREFLADPCRTTVDCLLSDVRMPDIDGMALQEELLRSLPWLSIIFVTGRGSVPMSVRAMKAGAVDVLEKPVKRGDLLSAINQATQRSRALRAERDELDLLRRGLSTLTPREKQVFELVTAGLLNKQVGYELGAAEKTIKVHRARVMEKMDAESLADLVRMAQRLGMRNQIPDAFRVAHRPAFPRNDRQTGGLASR